MYCLFLTVVLPLFEEGNLLLQKEEPVIHLMHSILTKQLRNLFVRFIKPEVITKNKDRLHSIDMMSQDNQVADEKLFIGNSAREYLSKNMERIQLNKFYDSVRRFYVTSSRYMCVKFPYDNELLIKAKVLQISTRQEADFDDLLYFVNRYPCLLKVEEDLRDQLQGQFLNYQVDDAIVWAEGDRIDTAWSVIAEMRNCNRQLQYELLARVMLGIATTFHSNADCERLFSYVTKNKTEFRSKLSTRTLSCLVTRKVRMKAMGTPCYKAVPSKDVLRKAKSACYNKLM